MRRGDDDQCLPPGTPVSTPDGDARGDRALRVGSCFGRQGRFRSEIRTNYPYPSEPLSGETFTRFAQVPATLLGTPQHLLLHELSRTRIVLCFI